MLEVKIVTDVVTEPVTVAEAKTFMVIDSDYTGDDTLITGLITAARLLLEKHTNLSFAAKTLKCFTDKSYLEIPYGPIVSVTNVVNQDDEEITSDNYTLKGLDFKRIYLGASNSGYFYPIGGGAPVLEQIVTNTNYTITYTAGYTTLPETLKLAIKEQVNHMYNNRGEGGNKLNLSAKILADSYSRNPLL